MSSRTFADAWRQASQIDGWLSEREASLLWDAAQEVPQSGMIVEVGAYRGRSTCLLAQTGRRLVTVDPLAAGFGEGNGMAVVEADAERLARLIARFDNVRWVRARSTHVAPPPRIWLLYIDGDHTGSAPLDDYRHFAPAIQPGGLVAFHDFRSYPAVTDAVLELEAAGELVSVATDGSMWLGRKK